MPLHRPRRSVAVVVVIVLTVLTAASLAPADAAAACAPQPVGRGYPVGAAPVEDGFWVAWLGTHRVASAVFVRHLDLRGRPTGPAVRVGAASDPGRVDVAGNDAGALLAWTSPRGDAGRYAVRAAPLHADGTIGAVTELATDAAAPIDLAPYGARRFVATWVEDRRTVNGGLAVHLRRLSATGEPVGARRVVARGTESLLTASPAVALARPGLLVLWETIESFGPHRVGGLVRGPFARLLGGGDGPVALADDFQDTGGGRSPAVAGHDGALVTLWTDAADAGFSSRLLARAVDGRTGELGPTQVLARNGFALGPALAVDARGHVLAAWTDAHVREVGNRALARWLHPDATPASRPILLSERAGIGAVATQPGGRFLAVYSHIDDLAAGLPLVVARCLDAP